MMVACEANAKVHNASALALAVESQLVVAIPVEARHVRAQCQARLEAAVTRMRRL